MIWYRLPWIFYSQSPLVVFPNFPKCFLSFLCKLRRVKRNQVVQRIERNYAVKSGFIRRRRNQGETTCTQIIHVMQWGIFHYLALCVVAHTKKLRWKISGKSRAKMTFYILKCQYPVLWKRGYLFLWLFLLNWKNGWQAQSGKLEDEDKL